MPDEFAAGAQPVDEPERLLGNAAARRGPSQRRRGTFRSHRVCRMRFRDDRTTGGDRRRGVLTGNREGEREVARTEDGDGSERVEHPPQIRQRTGGGGARVVDRRLEVRTLAHNVGEETELVAGACDLGPQPRFTEGGL